MRTPALVVMWIVRVAGVVQLLLGVSIWIGFGYRLLPVHLVNGVLIVVGLWTLAVLALAAGGRPGLATFAIVWGLALPAFGWTQSSILVGSWHWVIQVGHLLMGVVALGTADALAKHVLATRPSGVGERL